MHAVLLLFFYQNRNISRAAILRVSDLKIGSLTLFTIVANLYMTILCVDKE